MSNTVDSAVGRKVALDLARRALRTGARSDLEGALAGLPQKGKKAENLREKILKNLEKIANRKNCDLELGNALASCSADGVQFEFRMAEIGDNSFFSARRKGAKILVTLNSLHAFGREFGGIDEWSHPAVLALLAAWARCEIDSADTPQSDRYEEVRSDWGRVLRALLGTDSPFSSRASSYL